MKSIRFRSMLTLLTAILCLVAMTNVALAAEPLTVDLGAQITLEGTLPKNPETFTIRMTADDEAFPMPGGQTGGSFDLQIKGAAKGAFPTITYDKLGIYTYDIRQVPGTNEDCTYDAHGYQMKVTVTNAEEGDGFVVTVALHEEGKVEKPDSLHFHNVYKTIVTPPGDITPTGVNDLWVYYLGGSALLLAAACLIFRSLRRREDH